MTKETFYTDPILSTQYQEEEDVLVMDEEVDAGEPAELVVFNDDHNTFEWVIKTFIDILKHNLEQAEQCSMLIHFKGRATVKTASERILRPLREGLADRGLSAVIERID
ncbi:MAG: ATP-dependent Clp protease adaptor ClpS [Saprospiraceae bacterium]|nr:ATP-dependent Clp protease adaptor ClpS [Saprospiraceae bacterium]